MLVIDSLLPNPTGPDTGAEWIKLVNNGDAAVNLSGWSLKDASGKTFILSGVINPRGELVLKNSQTKIILNNNADTIYLYDKSGKLADSLSYESSIEGEPVTRVLANQADISKPIPLAINSSRTIPSMVSDFTPVAVGIFMAIVMGVIAAYVTKCIYVENGKDKHHN